MGGYSEPDYGFGLWLWMASSGRLGMADTDPTASARRPTVDAQAEFQQYRRRKAAQSPRRREGAALLRPLARQRDGRVRLRAGRRVEGGALRESRSASRPSTTPRNRCVSRNRAHPTDTRLLRNHSSQHWYASEFGYPPAECLHRVVRFIALLHRVDDTSRALDTTRRRYDS